MFARLSIHCCCVASVAAAVRHSSQSYRLLRPTRSSQTTATNASSAVSSTFSRECRLKKKAFMTAEPLVEPRRA